MFKEVIDRFINALNAAAQWFVYANGLVGLAAWAWVRFVELVFQLPGTGTAALAGWGTVAAYGYMRIFELGGEHSSKVPLLKWLLNHPVQAVITLAVSTLAAGWQMIHFVPSDWPPFLIFVAVAVLYPLSLPMGEKMLGIRSTPGIKLLTIAATWVGLTSFFPLWRAGIAFGSAEIGFMLVQGFFLMGLTLPFDIRDLVHDPVHIRSLPQLVGETKARILATSFMVLATAGWLVFALLYSQVSVSETLAVALVFGGSVFLVHRAKSSLPDAYFSWVLEALPMLLPLSLVLARLIWG